MRLILFLLMLPLLLLFLALILLWLPLPSPFPAPGDHARNLPAAIITGGVGLAGLIGLLLYAISLFAQTGQVLDPVLIPAGLSAQSYTPNGLNLDFSSRSITLGEKSKTYPFVVYMLFGQAYRGTLRGRMVDVYYVPSRSPWPALLDVHISATPTAQAAMGRSRPLLDCRDCPQLDLQEPGLDKLEVYTQDAAWVKRLAADPEGRAALERLMLDQAISGFRELYFQPDKIWLRAHPVQIAPAQFQAWLDDLFTVAQVAEQTMP